MCFLQNQRAFRFTESHAFRNWSMPSPTRSRMDFASGNGERGKWSRSKQGTPQGGVISPLLACKTCTYIGSTSCLIGLMGQHRGRTPDCCSIPMILSCWRAIRGHACSAGSKRRSRTGGGWRSTGTKRAWWICGKRKRVWTFRGTRFAGIAISTGAVSGDICTWGRRRRHCRGSETGQRTDGSSSEL